jgi:hypothetical protein
LINNVFSGMKSLFTVAGENKPAHRLRRQLQPQRPGLCAAVITEVNNAACKCLN